MITIGSLSLVVLALAGTMGWLWLKQNSVDSFSCDFGRHGRKRYVPLLRVGIVTLLAMFISLCALPALAHDDDDKPIPPDAKSKASAAVMVELFCAVGAAGAVFYGIQRYSVVNGSGKPPEYQSRMTLIAVGSALAVGILVWIVIAALSKPEPRGHAAVIVAKERYARVDRLVTLRIAAG